MTSYDPRYARGGRAVKVPKISMNFRDVKAHEVPGDLTPLVPPRDVKVPGVGTRGLQGPRSLGTPGILGTEGV